MSVIDSAEVTSTIEPCQSAGSSLNSKVNTLSYLKLAQTRETSFLWRGQSLLVADAPAEAFDTWIAEVVEEIVNVDRERWDIYDRWNIINACLEAEVVLLAEVEGQGGSLQLSYAEEAIPTQALESGECLE